MNNEELRELDAWISKNIFGRDDVEFSNNEISWDAEKRIPSNYTTDAASAMQVLEKCLDVSRDGVYGYYIEIANRGSRFNVSCFKQLGIESEADTLPIAICLFAKELFEKTVDNLK